ncbi:MAG: rhodanese-like domain-containing protein [Salinivirgaceae bacterium]
MNTRVLLSIWLIGLGLILAVLPDKKVHSTQLKPNELLEKAIKNDYVISVDKVARSLVTDDSTVVLVDLRSPEEFKECNIPGAINIPYANLLDKENEGYWDQKEIKLIFYSNGSFLSAQAWTLCTGMGYQNIYIMEGGMNEWYKTVLNSRFVGEQITARENALFETRLKARKLFIEMNSLPDSLKINFREMKQKTTKKLDGGCG